MILITGATGTVGSEVVKRLSAQGMQARGLTRDLRKVEATRLPHVQFVQGDFDDLDSLRRACTGVERAFLLSNSTERAEQQQIAFVEVAQKSGVRRIVKLSQLHADVNQTAELVENGRNVIHTPAKDLLVFLTWRRTAFFAQSAAALGAATSTGVAIDPAVDCGGHVTDDVGSHLI